MRGLCTYLLACLQAPWREVLHMYIHMQDVGSEKERDERDDGIQIIYLDTLDSARMARPPPSHRANDRAPRREKESIRVWPGNCNRQPGPGGLGHMYVVLFVCLFCLFRFLILAREWVVCGAC